MNTEILSHVTDLFIDYYKNKEDILGTERLGQYIINRLSDEEAEYLFSGHGGIVEHSIYYGTNNVLTYQLLMDRINEVNETL